LITLFNAQLFINNTLADRAAPAVLAKLCAELVP
jgi:hypothetical protein